MKIFHEKGSNFVTFTPSGKFISKIRTFLRLSHHKLEENEEEYEIKESKSKKKYLTHLPTLLKKPHRDVLIIYKWGTQSTVSYVNKKGFKKKRNEFRYTSEIYSNLTDKKESTANLIKYASQVVLDNYYAFQIEFSDESEPWPLHSITFKFI